MRRLLILAASLAVAAGATVAASAAGAQGARGARPAEDLASHPFAPMAATPVAARPARASTLIAAYSVVAPESVAASHIVARAIVRSSAACPVLVVGTRRGTRSVDMRVRTPGRRAAFAFDSVRVCESVMPTGATAASVSGTAIPAAIPATVQSVAVLGDTGCRIKQQVQFCLNPSKWPLNRVSRDIEQAGPDLVIHVGDYVYRWAKCPVPARCGTSPGPIKGAPFLDQAQTWILDVFEPMEPLFRAAPILFLRGNHEDCAAAGNGYFLFLDPRPGSAATCNPTKSKSGVVVPQRQLGPWSVDLTVPGGHALRLIAVDAAYGEDDEVTTYARSQRKAYAAARDLARGAAGSQSWLLVHRPIFGYTTTDYRPAQDATWTQWVSADQTAAAAGLLSRYTMIVSGHEHIAQAVQIPGQPAQVVAGNGATSLNDKSGYAVPARPPLVNGKGKPMSPPARFDMPSMTWVDDTFGYALLTPEAKGSWRLDWRDPLTEASFAECTIAKGRKATCAAAKSN